MGAVKGGRAFSWKRTRTAVLQTLIDWLKFQLTSKMRLPDAPVESSENVMVPVL